MESEGTYLNQIHFYIKDRGKTVKEVAAELGVSERMFNHYHHGRIAMPVGYRQRLADILNASVEEIFPKNISPMHRPSAPLSLALPTPPPIDAPKPETASIEEALIVPDLQLFYLCHNQVKRKVSRIRSGLGNVSRTLKRWFATFLRKMQASLLITNSCSIVSPTILKGGIVPLCNTIAYLMITASPGVRRSPRLPRCLRRCY